MRDVNSLAEITHGVAALWRLVEIRCEWISAAKQNEGLHHGDFTQSLWEKSQQFKQEIRHHNLIISVGYLRAAAFFRWRRSRVASWFCFDAIKMFIFKYGISRCYLWAKWCSVEHLLNLVQRFEFFALSPVSRPTAGPQEYWAWCFIHSRLYPQFHDVKSLQLQSVKCIWNFRKIDDIFSLFKH